MNNNWEQIADKWKQFTGTIKNKWGQLTYDEVMEVNGNRELLEDKLKEKYGITAEEARIQTDKWLNGLRL